MHFLGVTVCKRFNVRISFKYKVQQRCKITNAANMYQQKGQKVMKLKIQVGSLT